MAKAGKEKTVVKKVKAYPFPASVELKGIKKPVEIVKVAVTGVWASLDKTVVQVGMVYNIDFELPVLRNQVICPAKVLRTMDRILEAGTLKQRVERLAELQFVNPSEENKDKIRTFLRAINQEG